MPFKAPEQIKCPRCTKSVYAAEARAVGELSFHKECFKCSMCNKALDSTNQNCHERVLYCKTCHGRKFGPKGYGFGGGAAGLSMDSGAHLDGPPDSAVGRVQQNYKPPKAPAGEGCPRCGGCVYSAEEVLAKGKAYHKTCFNCKSCRKALDSMQHCDGPDKEVYCKGCYGNKFGPQGYGFGQGGGTLTSKFADTTSMVSTRGADKVIMAKEGEESCPRCGGKVYSAEMMMAKDRGFHKKCFKCRNCKRPLDSMTHCDGTDGEVYCKLCYAKKYGPKGYGFAAGAGGVLTAENIPGGDDHKIDEARAATASIDVAAIRAKEGEGCPRCGGKVFAAEEINARGRSFHKRCYNCCCCHRPLDSVVGCDSPDGEVYCKLCYAKRYGPKGYGFAAGGGGVMTAENIGGSEEHQVKAVSDFARLDVGKIQAKDGDGCPRCGGIVFMAETMHARGRKFHKGCYNCCHCHRPLDSMTGCDSPDGEVYCRLCYGKKYGPKGYGFAAGGGGVLTAENIPGAKGTGSLQNVNPTFAAIDTTCITGVGAENCPRCGGKVFSAEERLSGGGIKWHKRCYGCRDCKRPLDSMILCDGPDGDIYCKLCYARRFGPKGYGFASGAGGVLVPENIDVDDNNEPIPAMGNLNDMAAMDVSRIQAKEGQDRCPRCGGAVYQAEAIPIRNKMWHKPCYNCCLCHRPLDSMQGNDAPDGEVYCKLCYAKRHGPKGYGYGHCPALVSVGTEDGVAMPTDIRQFGFGGKLPEDWVPPVARITEQQRLQMQEQAALQHQQQQQQRQQQQQQDAPPSRWGNQIPGPEYQEISNQIPVPRGFNAENFRNHDEERAAQLAQVQQIAVQQIPANKVMISPGQQQTVVKREEVVQQVVKKRQEVVEQEASDDDEDVEIIYEEVEVSDEEEYLQAIREENEHQMRNGGLQDQLKPGSLGHMSTISTEHMNQYSAEQMSKMAERAQMSEAQMSHMAQMSSEQMTNQHSGQMGNQHMGNQQMSHMGNQQMSHMSNQQMSHMSNQQSSHMSSQQMSHMTSERTMSSTTTTSRTQESYSEGIVYEGPNRQIREE